MSYLIFRPPMDIGICHVFPHDSIQGITGTVRACRYRTILSTHLAADLSRLLFLLEWDPECCYLVPCIWAPHHMSRIIDFQLFDGLTYTTKFGFTLYLSQTKTLSLRYMFRMLLNTTYWVLFSCNTCFLVSDCKYVLLSKTSNHFSI